MALTTVYALTCYTVISTYRSVRIYYFLLLFSYFNYIIFFMYSLVLLNDVFKVQQKNGYFAADLLRV